MVNMLKIPRHRNLVILLRTPYYNGEGGAIFTNSSKIKKSMESIRDWGRDCWCKTGCDNTCKKRFDWKFEKLPYGYDHKYVYSALGYNLK